MKARSPKTTAGGVYALLRDRFCAPAWVLLPQIRNGTGYSSLTDRAAYGDRTADAIAMSVWPSRGLDLHGFEIKISRSDWLSEMRQPAKAESILQFCDRWWLVVPDEKIILAGELPPTWGLLVARGKRLVAKVEAPKLEAKSVDRLFLGALLRGVAKNYVPHDHLSSLVNARLTKELDHLRTVMEHGFAQERSQLGRYKNAIVEFEEKSGLRIDDWQAGRIGEAVQIFLRHGNKPEEVIARVRELEASARRIANAAERELEVLEEMLARDKQSSTPPPTLTIVGAGE